MRGQFKYNKNILIVEDETSMRKILARTLISAGFDVSEAQNGKQGFEKALREKPDLILLDIVMPKMNGLAMLKKLRKYKFGQMVPVILLTNLKDPEKIVSAVKSYTKTLDNGMAMYDYLIKSDLNMHGIVKRVKQKLDME